MPFDQYVQARIFDPLGIAGADWRRSPSGEVQSGGQLGMRAEDLARIGRMLLDAGEFDGQTIISREWLREMFTPRIGASPETDYSYLWWATNFIHPDGIQEGVSYMSGNGGNMVLLFPQSDMVIVILATNYGADDASARSRALITITFCLHGRH